MVSTFAFTAHNNIPFVAHRVDKGMRYGLNNCLTHTKDDALIEFYDARYPHTEYGQFVSRYYVSSLKRHNSNKGLILHGDEPDWEITADNMQAVLTALAS